MHDVPSIFYSPKKSVGSPFTPIIGYSNISNSSDEAFRYHSNIQSIFDAIIDIKLEGYIPFLWGEAYEERININLYSKYSRALKEIQFYSMALKQHDPFLEFLSYYRIIESLAGDSGKKWIGDHLDNALQYNFGFLEIYDSVKNSFDEKQEERINLFSIYKERAMTRRAEGVTSTPKTLSRIDLTE